MALAYYAIPVLLFWFVRRSKDFKFNWILVAFAALSWPAARRTC